MNKLAMPLTSLAAAALLAGCGAQSGSTGAAPSSALVTTPPATALMQPSASPPSPTSAAGAPTSAAGASTSAAGASTAAGAGLVPAGATTATLVYVGPTSGTKPLHASKDVTGATYERLVQDLNSLQPDTSLMQCNVLTGETATITVTSGGHTAVFTVPGSPCRGVEVAEDGAPMKHFAGSMPLLNQVRAIAGFTGLAHPLTTG